MNNKIAGLIIAAGYSSRMGEFKPLLQYKSKSFLQNIISKLNLVCEETLVVTGHNRDAIEKHLKSNSIKKVKTIFNKDYNSGMFTSLQYGLSNLSSYDWVIYHFVDQPAIDDEFYTEFVLQIENNSNWIQPTYKGKKGHPILIKNEISNIIFNAEKKSNLKEVSFSNKTKKKYWKCKHPQILDDIDTIERYNELS